MEASKPDRRSRRRQERGAGIVEYALLVALIAVAVLTAVRAVGDSTSDKLQDSASSVAAS
jgi:Flp pilus assembly pilin Flp